MANETRQVLQIHKEKGVYYFQVAVTLLFAISLVVSILSSVVLSIRVGFRGLDSRVAMKRTFISSFCTWMSLFLVYSIWTDKRDWDITTGTMAFVLFLILSMIFAAVSAFGLWNWKR